MKPIVWLVAGTLLVAIAIAAAVLLMRPAGTAPTSTATSTPQNPFGTAGSASTGSVPAMNVAEQDGSMLQVKDFIHDGTAVPDPQNAGSYFIAKSSSDCQGSTCPSNAKPLPYNIVYMADEQSFIIALLTEPLSSARAAAEQDLMNALGLTESQMCALKYYVGTDSYTNSVFAGQNLGFSFCPGAAALP